MARNGSIEEFVERCRFREPLYVTRPTMPPLDDFTSSLERIWATGQLTNNGPFHRELERRLADYLGLPGISLFCNGTVALLVALRALGIGEGEVITTPLTFPATVHALSWSGVTPVFGDIEEETCTLDPAGIERLIGPETRAVLPVHLYGNPCDVDAIHDIASRNSLPVIYDAAHAMGVARRGRSLAAHGDMSVFSFHATKVFSTLEGGALAVPSKERKAGIDLLRNFGIADEETVPGTGINGKMNEIQAAFGLMQLESLDGEIESRRRLTRIYRERLAGIPGIIFFEELPDVKYNYGHLAVRIDSGTFGISRDDLHDALRKFNVFARKYFFPLCSRIPCYASLPSADPEELPVAERASRQVLCLPLYGTLPPESVERVCDIIAGVRDAGAARGAAGEDAFRGNG